MVLKRWSVGGGIPTLERGNDQSSIPNDQALLLTFPKSMVPTLQRGNHPVLNEASA
ncbi:MAG: hypothetical protein PHI49_08015 [Halothiobacillaceae bacterium]|nr:hypothetical protein [Halothiobacillaceae bacterium]